MNLRIFKETILKIVSEATKLKNQYTNETDALVNYACIFSHTKEEFEELTDLANKTGSIVKETPTGPIFLMDTLKTISGDLKILKIRKPFEDKPQLGYADFTLNNYSSFKEKYLSKENFKLTIRENYEMIGLKDPNYNVLTYFAYPPLNEQLKIN